MAVQCFAAGINNVNDWTRASRLRLNSTNTKVTWLGSYQQLKQVDIDDIPILSTQVKVAESTRDLELSSTASCHYRHMLLRFVELDSFTSDNYVQLYDQ